MKVLLAFFFAWPTEPQAFLRLLVLRLIISLCMCGTLQSIRQFILVNQSDLMINLLLCYLKVELMYVNINMQTINADIMPLCNFSKLRSCHTACSPRSPSAGR
jgi:hypothetical protein